MTGNFPLLLSSPLRAARELPRTGLRGMHAAVRPVGFVLTCLPERSTPQKTVQAPNARAMCHAIDLKVTLPTWSESSRNLLSTPSKRVSIGATVSR